MKITVLVVGIGAGDPRQLTGEAVEALNRVELFVVADKGAAARDLARIRTDLCRAVITHDRYRVVEVPDPERDPGGSGYAAAVQGWHAERTRRYAELIRTELRPGGTLGFLVWGDPALYDSTLRLLTALRRHDLDVDIEVVPGISSVSLLAARHRIVLNRIGQPVHITTGRLLVDEYHSGLGDVVVLLDGNLACAELVPAHPDLTIFWGAQLGLPDERLISGRLADVISEIRTVRAELRQRRGWVFDTYLLRPG